MVEKILIIDDDGDMQDILADILTAEGYEAIVSGDGKAALKEIKLHFPELILLDIKLPGMNGLELIKEIKKIDKDIAIIMLTAYGGIKDAVSAIKSGAYDYITKPFENEEIILNIRKALHIRHLSLEIKDLKRKLYEKTTLTRFIGESPLIREVLNQVKIVAPTNMTVIIQGESGTGKELIARLIHQESMRAAQPFISIDCGSIPESLIESELFGHERGAFTGAEERKIGNFEAANEGTIFLDEITNLPLSLQAKLLRVVQERKIHRVGGAKEIKIDIRIIAATNIVHADAVNKGEFREDLYHRLNEFNIRLPALRERKEDIPILTEYFLKEANLEFNKKIEGISREVIRSLLTYHWPGNVRELKNAIKRAALLADSNYIKELRLPEDAVSINGTRPFPFPGSPGSGGFAEAEEKRGEVGFGGASFQEIINKNIRILEREILEKALAQAKNNKTKAAKILKIDRTTLYSKIKSLKL